MKFWGWGGEGEGGTNPWSLINFATKAEIDIYAIEMDIYALKCYQHLPTRDLLFQ